MLAPSLMQTHHCRCSHCWLKPLECTRQTLSRASRVSSFEPWYQVPRSVRDCGISGHSAIRGRPGSLFQPSRGSTNRIFLASMLSSIRAVCPKRGRCLYWTVEVRSDWLVLHRTSALETNWYHLIASSLHRLQRLNNLSYSNHAVDAR